jgi:hypothetical protein
MEEDIVIIDSDGSQRNAVIVRRPPVMNHQHGADRRWPAPWTRPPFYPQPSHAPVPVVYQTPAPAPAPVATTTAAKTGAKSWIPDVVDILAALSPLPAPPTATGDLSKDFANAMQYAGGLAGSLKRSDLLHTAARILEKRL